MLDRGNMEPSGSLEKESGIEMPTAEKIKIPESAEDLLEKQEHNEKIKAELKTASIWEREETLADLIKLSERTDLNFPGIIKGVRDEIEELKKDLPTEKKTEKPKTPEEIKEERRTEIIKEIEKKWEAENGSMSRPLSPEEIEKNKERAKAWGEKWDGRTTQMTEEASEYFFDHKGMGKSSVPNLADKILAERFPEYAQEAKKHETAEKTKIYDNPEDDPVVEKMRKEISRIVNNDIEEAMKGGLGGTEIKKDYPEFVRSTKGRVAMQQWEIFEREYPEKALAYKEKIGPKKESLDRKVKPDEASVEKPEESKIHTEAEGEITPDEVIFSAKEGSEDNEGDDFKETKPENISQDKDDKEAGIIGKEKNRKNKDKSEKLDELIPENGKEVEGKVVEKTKVIPRNKNEKKAESLEESTQLLKEKIRDSKFCENIKELVNKLEKNSMVDSRAVIFLDRAIEGMEDAVKEDSMVSLKDINSYIGKVWGGINALPKDSKDIENANDAREVADILENIGESSSKIKIELGESKDKNLEESTEYFVALNKLIEKKRGILLDKEKKL